MITRNNWAVTLATRWLMDQLTAKLIYQQDWGVGGCMEDSGQLWKQGMLWCSDNNVRLSLCSFACHLLKKTTDWTINSTFVASVSVLLDKNHTVTSLTVLQPYLAIHVFPLS